MLPDYQIAVIGGGPAGARSAELLARAGSSVVLLEAEGPQVNNLCSGLLNQEGQAALGLRSAGNRAVQRLGDAAALELPQAVTRVPSKPVLEMHDLDNKLRLAYDPGYLNMDRKSFDAWLRERAEAAGADLKYNCRVHKLAACSSGHLLSTSQGDLSAGIVVDATGWRALSRKLLSSCHQLRNRSAPHVRAFQGTVQANLPDSSMWAVFSQPHTSYYGWLVPKGGGRFLLGAGFHPGARAEASAPKSGWSALQFMEERIEALGGRIDWRETKPEGCLITTITLLKQLWWGKRGVLPVGEAAGLVSPSSGDGIHFALEHALALSRALSDRRFAPVSTHGEHEQLTRVIQTWMPAALAELRFNCFKAAIASSPRLRGAAARAMGFYLRKPVQRLNYLEQTVAGL